MKKNNRLLILLAILVLGAAMLACEGSFSTANIPDAYMTSDSEGEQRTSSYGQTDVFYAAVELSNAPDDTELRAVWTAVDVDQEGADGTLINETEFNSGDGLVVFNLSNEAGFTWPTGTYQVEIYLNGELNTTIDFSVQ